MARRPRLYTAQTTTYEAGASSWECHGNVSTVPRSEFDASCSESAPNSESGGLGDLQAYVLTADASVSLEFRGRALAIYGITFARDACEAGDSPARATLEVAGPPATDPTDIFPDPTSTPVCSAARYPTPVASCGVLARWTGLDAADRHRVSLSTADGRRVVVVSAQIDGDADETQSRSALVGGGAATLATDAAGTTTMPTSVARSGTRAPDTGATEGQIRSIQTGQTGNTSKGPLQSSVLHGTGSRGLFSPIPATPSARGSGPRHSSARAVAAALTVVILAIVLALAFGLYRRSRRRIARLGEGIAPYGTVPESPTVLSITARSTIATSIHQKGQLVKCVSEAGPGDASGATSPISSPRPRDASRRESSLRQAVEGTGLTTQELLGLLDRLRAQESRSPRLTWRECESDVAPPGYND